VWRKQDTFFFFVFGLCLAIWAPGAYSQVLPANANPLLTPARQAWEKQRAGLQRVYFEFSETNGGTVEGWNYKVWVEGSAYFDQKRCYFKEDLHDEGYNSESAFDGETIWRRSSSGIRKTGIADAAEIYRYGVARFSYLTAAGIFCPEFGSDYATFSGLEPLGLRYLKTAELSLVESVGEKLRLTFQVADRLAAVQTHGFGPTPLKTEVEDPTPSKRKIVLLVDPKYNYAVVEREEWNALGKRVGHILSGDWKFYKEPGLWLPSRCVATYYARPRYFETGYSEKPIHAVTNSLTLASFEAKPISFSFAPKKAAPDLFAITDSTNSVPATADPIIERIQKEVTDRSQVMELASWLTDVYGPRLTSTPKTRAAGEWAAKKLRAWGLENVQLEPFECDALGWTSERFDFESISPTHFTINAAPLPWTVGTAGPVKGPAIRFDVHSRAEMLKYAGKLRNAFLLLDPPVDTAPHFEAQARRHKEERLVALSNTQPPSYGDADELEQHRFTDRLLDDPEARQWIIDQGVAAVLFTASEHGDVIFLSGNSGESEFPVTNSMHRLPRLKVAAESYGRIVRILEKNIPVTLSLDLQTKFHAPSAFNVVAELPGADAKVKDEVVMLGAHLDSWTFGTGATDDAAGCAMLMEAMRILKALDLKPRRTIRVALWTGEEFGALGSKAYVAKHLKTGSPSHDKFQAYFNLDGGTGKIRGIIAAHQPAALPIFDELIAPFKGMGTKTLSTWDIGGGDDQSFRRLQLATYSFMQDPIDYESRTHHSNADLYERLISDDLRFNSAFIAAMAWRAAQMDGKFPR
jgi:carboxypeptidase Q